MASRILCSEMIQHLGVDRRQRSLSGLSSCTSMSPSHYEQAVVQDAGLSSSLPPSLPRAPGLLPTRQSVTEGEPHPTAELVPKAARLYRYRPRRLCHQRAIHSSPDRSRSGQSRTTPKPLRPARLPAFADHKLAQSGFGSRGLSVRVDRTRCHTNRERWNAAGGTAGVQ
jgi:hypothetical protein